MWVDCNCCFSLEHIAVPHFGLTGSQETDKTSVEGARKAEEGVVGLNSFLSFRWQANCNLSCYYQPPTVYNTMAVSAFCHSFFLFPYLLLLLFVRFYWDIIIHMRYQFTHLKSAIQWSWVPSFLDEMSGRGWDQRDFTHLGHGVESSKISWNC